MSPKPWLVTGCKGLQPLNCGSWRYCPVDPSSTVAYKGLQAANNTGILLKHLLLHGTHLASSFQSSGHFWRVPWWVRHLKPNRFALQVPSMAKHFFQHLSTRCPRGAQEDPMNSWGIKVEHGSDSAHRCHHDHRSCRTTKSFPPSQAGIATFSLEMLLSRAKFNSSKIMKSKRWSHRSLCLCEWWHLWRIYDGYDLHTVFPVMYWYPSTING